MPNININRRVVLNRNISSTPSFIQYSTNGTVTTVGNYKVITLTNNSQTFSITSMPIGATFEVLFLAAGGGGGNMGGGGGGAYYHNIAYPAAVQSYAFSIGVKGTGATMLGTAKGTNGGNTTFDGVTVLGGGGGGSFDNTNFDGAAGGNGGGGGTKAAPTFAGGSGGVGVLFNGGNGDTSGDGACGGGGAGSSFGGNSAQKIGAQYYGGNGGSGYLSSINGTGLYYGSGGGGGSANNISTGGNGNGGNGARGLPLSAVGNGSFYGAGGGGGYYGFSNGGDGYDGVVIIKIQFQAYDSNEIIVIAGQSNGTDHFGGGTLANLPLANQDVQRDVYTYFKTVDNNADNGSWVQAITGVNTQTGTPQTGYYACSLLMGIKLRDTYNIKPYIIPTAVGGTYIANDVIPSWNSTHVGEYYDRMLTPHYSVATSKLTFTKEPILVWIHGESDSDTVAHGLAYDANLTALIAKWRTDIGYPNAKVIITKILSTYIGPPNLGLSDVRAAQVSIDSGDANVYLINTDAAGLTLIDGQHYTDTSAITLGELIADLISIF